MAGKNKQDNDLEKQNEKLDVILKKLGTVETQLNDLKEDNKSLTGQIAEHRIDNKRLEETLSE